MDVSENPAPHLPKTGRAGSRTQVRRSIAREAEELARVNRHSILEICSKDYDAQSLGEWVSNKTKENFEQWIRDPEKTVITGLLSGTISGVGLLSHEGWIRLLYVAPEALGKGLGKEMLRYLEDRARALGLSKITLESTVTAKEFYLRQGYRLLEEGPCSVGPGLKAFRMEKIL